MWKQKLGIGIIQTMNDDWLGQIECAHRAGFDGMFSVENGLQPVPEIKKALTERGMTYQFVHVLWRNMPALWEDPTDDGLVGVKEYVSCLESCAENEVPIMVAHAIFGMKRHEPTELGLERFSAIFRRAEELGVKIALENLEGEEYLEALYRTYKDSPAFGFCWDSGHEMCYNHSEDMLAKYGSKLIATHLNDNLGISDFGGEITVTDDLHLMPFDGAADWTYNMARLNREGYEGMMTFELVASSKKGRFDNEKYVKMTPQEFFTEAYARACRLVMLRERLRKEK